MGSPVTFRSTLARAVLFLAGSLVAPSNAGRADELTVLAAASLADVLTEAAPAFEASTSHSLRINFGASGALARQIREGAPADVFISADETRVDQLEDAGFLIPNTRRNLAANVLVVVVARKGGPDLKGLEDLRDGAVRRIVIGDPSIVPAGTYAKEHLQNAGLWTDLARKLIPVPSVRAALATVEGENADAGLVYRTDALVSTKVRVAIEIPLGDGPRIVYPAAVVRDSRAEVAARAFIDWLVAPDARAIFARHGFLIPRD